MLGDRAHRAPPPRTPAQDSVLRLALGMWAADQRADITPVQREWVILRLQYTAPDWQSFNAEEKAKLKEPLLAYMKQYHARIFPIVERQFTEDGSCP